MKVGSPSLPTPISEQKFLQYLELHIVAAGGNLFQVAEDLQVTRPTIYRWRSRAGPPSKRRWYGPTFRTILLAYTTLHRDILDTRSAKWRHQASRQILDQLTTALPALTDNNIYLVRAYWSHKPPEDTHDLTRTLAREEIDILHALSKPGPKQVTGIEVFIDDGGLGDDLIWQWTPDTPFTDPFPPDD